jgi:signal transduction histidine kinase
MDLNNLLEYKCFVQIQITEYQTDGQTMKMLQFIDISSEILYDQEKASNKFLSLINACISHELRNPLNSIIASNLEKRLLYNRLEVIMESMGNKSNKTIKKEFKKIMNNLNKSLQVQDSSANLMTYLVQDFLDYAQIKAGKFRLDIKKFNIRKTVENVMAFQKNAAKDRRIKLIAHF